MHNQDTFTGPSFSKRIRFARLCWSFTYTLLFRYSPRPLHSWRSFLLRCFRAKIGSGVHVYPSVKIWAPWNIEIGDQSGIGNDVKLYSQGPIKIGKRTVISQGSHLVTGTHDYRKAGFPLFTNPIVVGDSVWIAAEAFIHPGISIGDGCVVAARSVVTDNLPAWKVCAGHPCVPIKDRVLNKN